MKERRTRKETGKVSLFLQEFGNKKQREESKREEQETTEEEEMEGDIYEEEIIPDHSLSRSYLCRVVPFQVNHLHCAGRPGSGSQSANASPKRDWS